jgi:hypothetical protein
MDALERRAKAQKEAFQALKDEPDAPEEDGEASSQDTETHRSSGKKTKSKQPTNVSSVVCSDATINGVLKVSTKVLTALGACLLVVDSWCARSLFTFGKNGKAQDAKKRQALAKLLEVRAHGVPKVLSR